MSISKKIILFWGLCFLLFAFFPMRANADNATLEFKHVDFGDETVTTKLYLYTGGNTVSSVTADFTYPTDLLEVTGLDAADSVCTEIDRWDSSTPGMVFISCSLDGYTDGGIAVVTFKVKEKGKATLQFTADAAVVAAATAENIMGEVEDAVYTISEDLTVLPETGTYSAAQVMYALIFLVALTMLVIFAITGFTIWGGIYLSLGKWKVEGKYEVGFGKGNRGKKKNNAKAEKKKKK